MFLVCCGTVARAENPPDFARDVAPILQSRCLRCHQPGNIKGDLSLATGDDLRNNEYIVAGKPEESYLLELVIAVDGARPQMPKKGEPLSAGEIEVLRRWIASGGAWPKEIVLQEKPKADKRWWSLQPLASKAPPADGLDTEFAHWAHNPIDRFVFAKLAEKQLRPGAPADKRTLLRRLTYDLIGLPPTPSEVAAFLADESPDAYEKCVDRLLQSPHFGERWGRHWLDVVRFGESTGFERNVIIDNAWPFRDYVIRSFNEDKPFDRLVLEHLAGDVLAPGDPAVEVGTTFLVCGPYDNVGNQDPAQAAIIRANVLDDMIRATCETFLGFTIGCARCHHHKFDPLVQQDYYSLYATFSGVAQGSRVVATPAEREAHAARLRPLVARRDRLQAEEAELRATIERRANERAAEHAARWTRPKVARAGTEESFPPVEARFVRLVVEGLDANPEQRVGYRIDEFEVWTVGANGQNVALARNGGRASGVSRQAEDFRSAYSARLVNDGRFGERWIAGAPELTIELGRLERLGRVHFSSDRTGEAMALGEATFVSDYHIDVSTDGAHWTTVASSHDRQPVNDAHRRRRLFDSEVSADERRQLDRLAGELARVHAASAAVPPLPSWWVGTFTQPAQPVHVFLGGDPQKRGAAVAPASLALLSDVMTGYALPPDAPEGQRRLAFARWLVAPENPLTGRVLANRLWHYHFGVGLVDTPSDFGAMGSQPTHPELLDWLARQIVRGGWKLKPVHRLMVTSQAYRQSSLPPARLGSEPASDPLSIDADARYLWRFPPRRQSAEELRDSMLAIADRLDLHLGGPGFRLYRYLEDNVATYVPLDRPGPETYRRAVYHQNARAARVDLMSEFDCPDNALSAPRRAATTTPLQALTLLNHQFTVDMAAAFGARLERTCPAPDIAGQVRLAYQLAYSRPPAAEELNAADRLIRSHGLRAFCRAVFNSNEFLYVR